MLCRNSDASFGFCFGLLQYDTAIKLPCPTCAMILVVTLFLAEVSQFPPISSPQSKLTCCICLLSTEIPKLMLATLLNLILQSCTPHYRKKVIHM